MSNTSKPSRYSKRVEMPCFKKLREESTSSRLTSWLSPSLTRDNLQTVRLAAAHSFTEGLVSGSKRVASRWWTKD